MCLNKIHLLFFPLLLLPVRLLLQDNAFIYFRFEPTQMKDHDDLKGVR